MVWDQKMSLPLVLQAINKKNMSITEDSELVFLDSANKTTFGPQILVRVVRRNNGARV